MRPLTILATLFLINLTYSQQVFLDKYKIKNFLDFYIDGKSEYDYDEVQKSKILKKKIIFLSKTKRVQFHELTEDEQKGVKYKVNLVKNGLSRSAKFLDKNGNEFEVRKEEANNPKLYDFIYLNVTRRATTFGNDKTNNKSYRGWLMFEKDKIHVNLFTFVDDNTRRDTISEKMIEGTVIDSLSEEILKNNDSFIKKRDSIFSRILETTYLEKASVSGELDTTDKENPQIPKDSNSKDSKTDLFYKLEDDMAAYLRYTEGYITAITIPFKYRFSGTFDTISEEGIKAEAKFKNEFSTSFNAALFAGYSWGKTKFQHRSKVGNRTVKFNNSVGIFLGPSTVTLNASNTNFSENAPTGSQTRTVGLISFGTGYVWSWNKLALGGFIGIDYGIGNDSETWNFNGKPWIGFGVGYDLFKLTN